MLSPKHRPMQEQLLQFIWQHQYFDKQSLTTTQGVALRILQPGQRNTHQGPDFLQARIELDNTIWAGNIEVHYRTSDWKRHRHEADAQYQNVILHVVWEHDVAVNDIPVLALQGRISRHLLMTYQQLMLKQHAIPCKDLLPSVPVITWISWKARLVAERLEARTVGIFERLKLANHHWEEVFWWMLARNFGLPANADVFEAVAKTLPIQVLARHKHQIHQLEAMLMGQAGLLAHTYNDEYPQLLQREYQFLRHKHQLPPVPLSLKMLRMRPMAFPTVRLALLAMLIHKSVHLFSQLLEAETFPAAPGLLNVTTGDYWHTHYVFDEATVHKPKKPGKMFLQNLLINTVIPVLYAYGHYHGLQEHKEKAMQWLEHLAGENNHITRAWMQAGVEHQNAFDSQALLQLHKNYCTQQQCLCCAVGNAILKKEIVTS